MRFGRRTRVPTLSVSKSYLIRAPLLTIVMTIVTASVNDTPPTVPPTIASAIVELPIATFRV